MSSVGDGYTCQSCGAYVPYGCSHSCPSTQWIMPKETFTYTTVPMDTVILERIAKALERIADALNR